jgi:NADH-quinone oxidoreductase subunit G
MWVRNNEILRLTPRFNPQVNDYWMCDYGRLNTFKFVNASNRIKAPMIRKEGVLVEVGWDEAIAKVAGEMKSYKKTEVAGLGSAFATNEDNYLFVKLMKHLSIAHVDVAQHVQQGDEDNLLIRADKTPNSTGAREVGVKPTQGQGFEAILQGIREGKIKALYCLEDDLAADPKVAEVLSKLDFLVVHASNENATTALADVVLSSATYAEKHGTFTNFQGMVQRIRPAVVTVDQDRSLDGFAMSRLDKFGAPNDRWTRGTKYDARPSWRIVMSVANALGAKWKYTTSEEVFNEIASTIDSFKGLTYLKVGMRGAMLKKKSEQPATVKV